VILWELSERLRLRQVLTRLYRVELRGAEHVPAAGPCILVANHESLIDPWILCLATPRRVRFMAKAELWRYPGVRWAMEAYGTFPVERGNGDTGAMSRAGELLEGGELLGMFPRGTSKPAGNRVWHRGAARLALAHGAPIVPVRLVATRQLLPTRPMRVLVGSPIEVIRERPTIAAARALTAQAEAAVEALT
jgi:1-acyl-sn-glycerol-3-phosphate acyltransferase